MNIIDSIKLVLEEESSKEKPSLKLKDVLLNRNPKLKLLPIFGGATAGTVFYHVIRSHYRNRD